MKRLVQIVLLMMLATSLLAMSADAQIPIKFGLKGGINSATVTGDDAEGYESRSGIVGGVFTRLSLGGPIGIQAELLLASKGAKVTFIDEATSLPVDKTLKADYFEVPVLLRYSFKGQGPAGLNLYGGPVFAFGRLSKTEISTLVLGLDVGGDLDNYNEKSTDLGLALGIGVDLSLARSVVVLEVRYTVGLQDMWEDVVVADLPGDLNSLTLYADETTGKAFKMKNSALSFTVGFMF
ncbi:MAG: PorT family protein [candidate division Zixibacteria bacterium]|nr:PorT family protein [candidate division Zixibacteria bacterium]